MDELTTEQTKPGTILKRFSFRSVFVRARSWFRFPAQEGWNAKQASLGRILNDPAFVFFFCSCDFV
jgi:hypothetical protein